MMNNEKIYEITLEDYSFPRYASEVKSYYGTLDDIINLMVRLSDNDWTRTRYQETIEAAEYYDLDNEITHTVAGQVLPILTPVREICRFETRLNNQHWDYTTTGGVVYPCWAYEVEVCQSLIQTENGYERCLRATLSDLSFCHQSVGWLNVNNAIKGFPGVVTFDDNCHKLNLFVSQHHYEFDELDAATADVVNVNTINLAAIMADIIAEG